MRSERELVKHSSIYAIGQILSRFASVLVLPLYTHFLTPADYGVIAVLDLTTLILAMLVGAGMSSAVTRHHFDATSEQAERRVWWTGLGYVFTMSIITVLPMWIARDWLAQITLGPKVADGGFLYSVALATLIASATGELLDTFIRVKKWSTLYLVVSMGRLALNLGLNVWFLVGLGMGVKGQLLGNLIASVSYLAVLLVIFCCAMGRVVIDVKVGRELVKFGAPLIVNSLLQLLMHEADRYFLLAYLDMKEVGVYSLAYKVGQAVNTLCLIPFGSIWGVMIYEIAKQPDAKQQYARVFEYFVSAVLVLMLGASLSAVPLLPFLTTEAFDGAIQLLPVILLAFVFFTLHSQFNVPALLAKKTVTLVPSAIAGVATNLILNSILVPRFGATGAAWSSVMTYAVFSFSGLVMYRRIDVIPYPFAKCAAITAGIALTYVVVQHGLFPQLSLINQLLASILVCVAWTLILFGTLIAGWVKEKLLLRRVRPA